MYIIDGIAYAKEEQEFIEVVDVKALDDMIENAKDNLLYRYGVLKELKVKEK